MTLQRLARTKTTYNYSLKAAAVQTQIYCFLQLSLLRQSCWRLLRRKTTGELDEGEQKCPQGKYIRRGQTWAWHMQQYYVALHFWKELLYVSDLFKYLYIQIKIQNLDTRHSIQIQDKYLDTRYFFGKYFKSICIWIRLLKSILKVSVFRYFVKKVPLSRYFS